MNGAAADVLSQLRKRRQQAREQFGLELIGIVGSVARGDARPDSDVDVVLSALRAITLFDLARLQAELEDHLHRRVDLILSEDLPAERKTYLERNLVRI